MSLAIWRDGESLDVLPAQNYFETPSSQSTVLFVPFSLKPSEAWAHVTNFLGFFGRAEEKLYRESDSALRLDIRQKLLEQEQTGDKGVVVADSKLVEPFINLFERLFVWEPGEYVIELTVDAAPGSASFGKKYRFTLYESDSAELRSHVKDYPYGGGLAYNVERHVSVLVPLTEHRD